VWILHGHHAAEPLPRVRVAEEERRHALGGGVDLLDHGQLGEGALGPRIERAPHVRGEEPPQDVEEQQAQEQRARQSQVRRERLVQVLLEVRRLEFGPLPPEPPLERVPARLGFQVRLDPVVDGTRDPPVDELPRDDQHNERQRQRQQRGQAREDGPPEVGSETHLTCARSPLKDRFRSCPAPYYTSPPLPAQPTPDDRNAVGLDGSPHAALESGTRVPAVVMPFSL